MFITLSVELATWRICNWPSKKGSIINIGCELLPSHPTQNIIFAMVNKFKKKFEMVKENLVLGSQHIIKKSISTILTKITKTQKKLVMIMQT